MSKKETRRAARQAFPKAPGIARTGAGTGGRSVRAGSRSSGTVKGRGTGRPPALRPPTLKRAAIQGAILAVLYLIVIRVMERNSSILSSIIFALAGFVIYTGIAYAIDRFTYQRRLRRLKGPSK